MSFSSGYSGTECPACGSLETYKRSCAIAVEVPERAIWDCAAQTYNLVHISGAG